MQRHWSAVFITLLFISTSQSVLAQSLDPAYMTFGGGLILLLILTFYVIKQVCHIEKFQVRRSKLILNHIFSALMAYVEIQKNQFERIFENVYRWQKKLFRPVIKNFIDDFILDKNHLLPQRIYK